MTVNSKRYVALLQDFFRPLVWEKSNGHCNITSDSNIMVPQKSRRKFQWISYISNRIAMEKKPFRRLKFLIKYLKANEKCQTGEIRCGHAVANQKDCQITVGTILELFGYFHQAFIIAKYCNGNYKIRFAEITNYNVHINTL